MKNEILKLTQDKNMLAQTVKKQISQIEQLSLDSKSKTESAP